MHLLLSTADNNFVTYYFFKNAYFLNISTYRVSHMKFHKCKRAVALLNWSQTTFLFRFMLQKCLGLPKACYMGFHMGHPVYMNLKATFMFHFGIHTTQK